MYEYRRRIYLKTPSADKQLLRKAATLCHKSLAEFVLQATYERLHKVLLHSHDTITLSAAEWERFLVFLDTPDEPNAVLQAAAIEYLNRFHK